ncbi:hypothetical protein EMIHUDRAFT_244147 [Emiliania huxleyi CCMP1516]|uniref:Uncharacterized protein n=2 Tax=Emiliania huxleyi TaxID=2903 RepID=A0A0D3J1A8_EMIH1|nr:hypothetical protein EMIHUDRAFT_244147 [Emiliania huxleyi CCMP1516]EOD17293.1 hypothetical protein EMIHUDRAFT_244147 [Emiliania huxleyi CCMP1516]|eukprot:XP_005769722.1 hypothetical protein EMIHUDRAFT_244147 [Emiliania huxleyi CCMP1516]
MPPAVLLVINLRIRAAADCCCGSSSSLLLPDSVKPAVQRGVQNSRGFVPPEAERIRARRPELDGTTRLTETRGTGHGRATERESVAVLDAQWVVRHAEAGGVLTHRQALPKEAFLSFADLVEATGKYDWLPVCTFTPSIPVAIYSRGELVPIPASGLKLRVFGVTLTRELLQDVYKKGEFLCKISTRAGEDGNFRRLLAVARLLVLEGGRAVA